MNAFMAFPSSLCGDRARLLVPAKAVFTRAGKPVVYVLSRTGYHAVEVKVEARNPDEVAVTGIAAGTMVTLVEPDKQEGKV